MNTFSFNLVQSFPVGLHFINYNFINIQLSLHISSVILWYSFQWKVLGFDFNVSSTAQLPQDDPTDSDRKRKRDGVALKSLKLSATEKQYQKSTNTNKCIPKSTKPLTNQ